MSATTIENMVDWINNNITHNPTLEDMADYVGYSQFYCSTKFHEIIGITFKQYIAKQKLKYAISEITNTHIRFLDIAVEYGFQSQEAFTRAFVKEYGCTPGNYRREHNRSNL